MQTLSQFQTEHAAAKPFTTGADLAKYWTGRLVGQGFVRQGVMGADAYLERFGKGIGVAKVVTLARTCEVHGELEIARGFWIAAYLLTYGTLPPAEEPLGAVTAKLMIDGKSCSVCDAPFGPQDVSDGRDVIVTSTNPLQYAHEACYPKV
jgi:hypothetical protein